MSPPCQRRLNTALDFCQQRLAGIRTILGYLSQLLGQVLLVECSRPERVLVEAIPTPRASRRSQISA